MGGIGCFYTHCPAFIYFQADLKFPTQKVVRTFREGTVMARKVEGREAGPGSTLTRPLRKLLAYPLPKGYSPPASTQSFATDVKHLNHQLRHIDGSRSVAQDAWVSEHGLRNHMPTALDLVKGNDRRRNARPQESIR